MAYYFNTFLNSLLSAMGQSAPYVIVGFLISAFIHEFIPKKVIVDNLGSGKTTDVLKSVFGGSLIPVCSCSVIPVALSLRYSGAKVGTVFAFMISAAAISPIAVLLVYQVLGKAIFWPYVIFVILGSLIIGFIGNRFLTSTVNLKQNDVTQDTTKEKHASITTRIKRAFKWGYWELGADVSFDLFIGLCLAASLTAFIPQEWFYQLLGKQNFISLVLVVLIAIPVYTCSIPSIYVVHSFALLGATPGVVLAYLISGPATNLGELNAIRRGISLTATIFYMVSLITLALLAGVFMDNFIFPDYNYSPLSINKEIMGSQCCVPIFADNKNLNGMSKFVSTIPAYHWPFLILFFFIIVSGLFKKIKNKLKS